MTNWFLLQRLSSMACKNNIQIVRDHCLLQSANSQESQEKELEKLGRV